jgi:hypothetical protein
MLDLEYDGESVRRITDTSNPRVGWTEYLCPTCKKWNESDDVIWYDETIDAYVMDTANARPYCQGCEPSE